jgi:hypothetical protein
LHSSRSFGVQRDRYCDLIGVCAATHARGAKKRSGRCGRFATHSAAFSMRLGTRPARAHVLILALRSWWNANARKRMGVWICVWICVWMCGMCVRFTALVSVDQRFPDSGAISILRQIFRSSSSAVEGLKLRHLSTTVSSKLRVDSRCDKANG